MDRRTFIGNAAAIAAGAALGGVLSPGPKEYGPVDLWFHIFSPKPDSVKGALRSDAVRDLFRITVFWSKTTGEAEFRLSDVKAALAGRTVRCTAEVRNGENSRVEIDLAVRDGNLLLLEPGQKSPPVWIAVADVRKVL